MRREEDLHIRIDDDGEGGDLVERMSATIRDAVREATARAIEGAIDGSDVETGAPKSAPFVPIMNIMALKPNLAFVKEVADGRKELGKLLDNPPTLTGKATEDTDGRKVPVVVAVVRDPEGRTRPGIELQLFDQASGVLLDHSRTDVRGIAVLRFPRRVGDDDAAQGTLKITGADDPQLLEVPAGSQHAVSYIELDELPALDEVVDLATGGTKPEIPTPDDPYERLPADFSPALCDALVRLRGTVPDPILGKVASPDDFRSNRTPLIKRVTIPRTGETKRDGVLRRYLVRVRQEWIFLGYTLGELTGVDSLDPGSVIQDVTSATERTIEEASSATDRLISEALSTVSSSLRHASSIDSLLSVATSSSVNTTASGFGSIGVGGSIGGGILGGAAGLVLGPIGALAGGLFGGGSASVGVGGEVGTRTGTSVFASNTTTSRTNTSLVTNSLMHTAKSLLNETVRTATNTLRSIETTVARQLGSVSPLLSRVTNLLRWTVYENYAVVTHVEDVVEVRSVRITEPKKDEDADGTPDEGPLFDVEDIVENRRFFEPALLEPQLQPHFRVLRDALDLQRAGGPAITAIHFEFDYSASLFSGNLRVAVGATETTVTLRPGRTTARGTLYIPPTLAEEIDSVRLDLNALLNIRWAQGSLWDRVFDSGGVTVSRMRVWFNRATGGTPQQVDLSDLGVTNDARATNVTIGLEPKVPQVDLTRNPLYRHINRNRTYYFGVLAQAALEIPSLRDDARQLAIFNGDHDLWRLPIVGFEGDRVLVISDVDKNDPDAERLMDDAGAATIIQLAAPGAYSEALQGLLSLTDAAGKIHPALEPPPAPAVPPLGLIDLTGKRVEVVDGVVPEPPIG